MGFERARALYWSDAQMRQYMAEASVSVQPFVSVWFAFQAVRLHGPEWNKT